MTETTGSLHAQTLSRALLVPGPQPPLSHFGATLLRHVVGTVVRYSLYQLGLPMPESPPVRIVRLRVFLDSIPLAAVLGAVPAGPEILAALVQPAGAGELDATAGRVRAAAALHRARLAALGPRRGRSAAGPPGAGGAAPGVQLDGHAAAAAVATAAQPAADGTSGATKPGRDQLWATACSLLAGRMPYLCDAALGELVSTIGRRRLRLSDKALPGALGQVAFEAHRGRNPDLRALGPLDPRAPSWAETGVDAGEVEARAGRARAGAALPLRSGRRGGFREAYRWVLSELRPLLIELGERATEDGIVDQPDDVFFLPFDLGVELGAVRRPSWLAAAVAANRREHQALEREPEPADEIVGPPAVARLSDRASEWEIAPLLLVE